MQTDALTVMNNLEAPKHVRDVLTKARTTWLKNTEVCDILANYKAYHFPLSKEAPVKPAGGWLFLFNRKVVRFFRKDGHKWRKKADGKTVRETHEKLKVGNKDMLNCYYAHAESHNPLQRRCYWLLEGDDSIVLVHYLNAYTGVSRLRSLPEQLPSQFGLELSRSGSVPDSFGSSTPQGPGSVHFTVTTGETTKIHVVQQVQNPGATEHGRSALPSPPLQRPHTANLSGERHRATASRQGSPDQVILAGLPGRSSSITSQYCKPAESQSCFSISHALAYHPPAHDNEAVPCSQAPAPQAAGQRPYQDLRTTAGNCRDGQVAALWDDEDLDLAPLDRMHGVPSWLSSPSLLEDYSSSFTHNNGGHESTSHAFGSGSTGHHAPTSFGLACMATAAYLHGVDKHVRLEYTPMLTALESLRAPQGFAHLTPLNSLEAALL